MITEPLVLGHRANTPRWLRRLLAEGADGVEVDIYQRGGRVLVGHLEHGDPPRLLRLRLASLLASLHASPSRPAAELLRLLPRGTPVMLDLKSPVDPGLLQALLEKAGVNPRDVMVSTRWHSLAEGLASIGVEVYLSIDHEPAEEELRAASRLHAAGVSVRASYYTARLRRLLPRYGLRAAVWTVNTPETLEEVRTADIIVTDKPGLVKKLLGAPAQRGLAGKVWEALALLL